MSGYFFISQLTSPHTHTSHTSVDRRAPTTVDRAHRLTDRLTGSTAAAAEGTLFRCHLTAEGRTPSRRVRSE